MRQMDTAIAPDDKDWTWVLERACPECGVDVSDIERTEVASLIRSNAAAWVELLARDVATVSTRPAPNRWSTLEYAAHVRDVFRIFRGRLALMVDIDDPLFENWDQDATAVADRYGEQAPDVVSAELVEAGNAIATAFAELSPDDDQVWRRTGRRSDGASFTVDTFARYFLHDPMHHLWDVQHS